MKIYAICGASTLQAALNQYPNAAFLRMARDIAASHHERFDGSGYPKGLSGQDIPLCGRIVALADVYDALTSKRVYKEAIHRDVTPSIIGDETGKHFDPEIGEAFQTTEAQFIKILERYGEETA